MLESLIAGGGPAALNVDSGLAAQPPYEPGNWDRPTGPSTVGCIFTKLELGSSGGSGGGGTGSGRRLTSSATSSVRGGANRTRFLAARPPAASTASSFPHIATPPNCSRLSADLPLAAPEVLSRARLPAVGGRSVNAGTEERDDGRVAAEERIGRPQRRHRPPPHAPARSTAAATPGE